MKVLEFPLSKITICFVLGILLAVWTGVSIYMLFVLLILASIGYGIAYYYSKSSFFQKPYLAIMVYAFAVIVGMTTQAAHNAYFQKNNYIHYCKNQNQSHFVWVSLREKIKSTSKYDRFYANVKQFDNKKSSGKILINIAKDSVTKFEIGDNLWINTKVILHKPPLNPGGFDYGGYLTSKSVFAQLYVKQSQLKQTGVVDKNIWFWAAKFRNKIIQNLENQHYSARELAVLSALILGQQQDIAPDILQNYQFSGAIHILSVSGLHVGYVLLFVEFILRPIPRTRKGNLIRFLIILVSLWLFAIVAGFSPSVVRSAAMFSFVAAGISLKRETDILYTLLLSLLFILCFEPSFLFDVGFQLSYVCLFFILWLQPHFDKLWRPKHKITKTLWRILTVSFAAQIGALPLSIFYFHQFPGLFFVTNLVVLPFIGLIMLLGGLVMLLGYFDFAIPILTKISVWSIVCLNAIIAQIATYEKFIIQDISFSKMQLICTYLMLFAVFIWYIKPNFFNLKRALLGIFLFQIGLASSSFFNQNQTEAIVFHVPKKSLIVARFGQKVMVYGDPIYLEKPNKINALRAYLIENNSKIVGSKNPANLLFLNQKKIIIMDSVGIYPKNCRPDLVILTQSTPVNLDRLIVDLHPKMVVVDGSNYFSKIKLWKASCMQQKIPFHATAEKGFYKIE